MYSEKEARELVTEAGRKLVEKKLIARTWGNISARIGEDTFVITPSGRSYNTLTPDDMVIVHISDLSHEGDIMPSSEKGVHAEAYQLRSDVDFIVHTHQFYASVISSECRSTENIPCAAYALPGTAKLRKHVGESIRSNPDKKCFLMARHGALILASTSDEAFGLAEQLEEDCRKLFEARVSDLKPKNVNTEDISRFSSRKTKFMNMVKDPYVLECCSDGVTLRPYLDDFAQIAGPDIACVPNNTAKIKAALIGRNAVLIKGKGALCTGESLDDVEAVASIVSKNCACACYVRRTEPLGIVDAAYQRHVYKTSYSKRNRAKDEEKESVVTKLAELGKSILIGGPVGSQDSLLGRSRGNREFFNDLKKKARK